MSARAVWRLVRWCLGLSLLGGFAVGGYVAYAALDHPISRVRIDGEVDPAERAQVEAVVNSKLGGGVLSADVHAIADGLRALGWTRDVSVRRVWPDCIEVALTHSVPIARWNTTHLLGDDGRSYAYVGQKLDKALPSLYGPAREAPEVVRHYRVLRTIFGPAGLLVTRAGQDEKGNWAIRLDERIDVLLGNREVVARAQRVVDLYRRYLEAESERIRRVDARYANGVAVAWTDPLPAAAQTPPAIASPALANSIAAPPTATTTTTDNQQAGRTATAHLGTPKTRVAIAAAGAQ